MTAKNSQHGMFRKVMRDPTFWGPIAVIGVSGIAATAQNAYEKFQETGEKARAYKEMLDLHPRIKMYKNRDQVQRLYNSLHNVNPILAKDPLVAGAWVDNIIEAQSGLGAGASNQALLSAVKDLAGIRSQIAAAHSNEARTRPSIGPVIRELGERSIENYNRVIDRYGDAAAARQEVQDLKRRHMEQNLQRGMRDATRDFVAARRALEDQEKGMISRIRKERNRLAEESIRARSGISHGGRVYRDPDVFGKQSSVEGQRLLAAIR